MEISGGSPIQSTGRVWLATEKFLEAKNYEYICSNFCRRIKLKNINTSYFFYCHMVRLYDQGRMFIYENSTTGVKNFNISSFLDSEFIALDKSQDLLESFNIIYQNISNIIINNGQEKQILAESFNLLLSRLIIGDSQKAKEEV